MGKAAALRSMLGSGEPIYTAGAHNGLGAVIAARAGFHAIWASSFEISAARGLPDAGLLGMTDFLEVARQLDTACDLPIVADCDTGFGNELNVAHLVRQYEAAGIAGLCMEDKVFPKMNSFAGNRQRLVSIEEFQRKIRVAKRVQTSPDTVVIARTEAFIAGQGLAEALQRANAYADAGADVILIHSKSESPEEVESFLSAWQHGLPVAVVPTTYPSWSAHEAAASGASMVIYANHGLRASVSAVSHAMQVIRNEGKSSSLEANIATVKEIFDLQRLDEWIALEK